MSSYFALGKSLRSCPSYVNLPWLKLIDPSIGTCMRGMMHASKELSEILQEQEMKKMTDMKDVTRGCQDVLILLPRGVTENQNLTKGHKFQSQNFG